MNEHNREQYKNHPETFHIAQKAYRKNHPRRVDTAGYRKEHLPEFAAYNAARRALILGVTVGSLAEIREIYRRAKEDMKIRCYLCGNLIPKGHRHVDHIMPLGKGGAHRPSNLAVACDGCNLQKYSKLPEEVGILL